MKAASTSKVRVYRVEKDGEGPFSSCDKWLFYDWFSVTNNPRHHRCTIDSEDRWGYVFGCLTKEELTDYFGEDNLNRLIDNGYEVKSFMCHERYLMFGDGEVAMPRSQLPQNHRMYRPNTRETFEVSIPPIEFRRYAPLSPVEISEGTTFGIDMGLMA